MQIREQIILFYQVFYIDYLNRQNYLFVPSKQEEKTINKFIQFLEEKYTGSYNYNLLYNFFSYQFFHYSKKEAIKSRSYLKIGHVVNEKAINRFNSAFDSQKQKGIEYAISRSIFLNDFIEIIDFDKKDVKISKLNNLNEIERKRFWNTEYGFSHCISLGIEFSVGSPTCFECDFKLECKE